MRQLNTSNLVRTAVTTAHYTHLQKQKGDKLGDRFLFGKIKDLTEKKGKWSFTLGFGTSLRELFYSSSL